MLLIAAALAGAGRGVCIAGGGGLHAAMLACHSSLQWYNNAAVRKTNDAGHWTATACVDWPRVALVLTAGAGWCWCGGAAARPAGGSLTGLTGPRTLHIPHTPPPPPQQPPLPQLRPLQAPQ